MPAAHPQLSQTDLRMIAGMIHRDFSPVFVSTHKTISGVVLTRQELQDIADQIRREFAPGRDNGPSQLTLLPISPKRLHAYWRIADAGALNSLQTVKDNRRLILRVYRQTVSSSSENLQSVVPDEHDEWLDMIINGPQGQDDIVLPEPTACEVTYRAVIGNVDGQGRFQALVRSEPTETIAAPAPDSRLETLSPALAAFIMSATPSASTFAKSGSGQGNFQSL